MLLPKLFNRFAVCRFIGEGLLSQSLYERLELQNFPCDCQELTIEVESQLPNSFFKIVPWREPDSEPVAMMFDRCYLNDFTLFAKRPFTYAYYDTVSRNGRNDVSVLKIVVNIKRLENYYMINVVLIMCAIATLTFLPFASHPADIEARQNVDFQLILTAVAYKLVLTDMLPSACDHDMDFSKTIGSHAHGRLKS